MNVFRDMAHDGGYRGEEAEQVARMLEEDALRAAEEEAEARRQAEVEEELLRLIAECPLCEGVGLVEKVGPAGVPHTEPCPRCKWYADIAGSDEEEPECSYCDHRRNVEPRWACSGCPWREWKPSEYADLPNFPPNNFYEPQGGALPAPATSGGATWGDQPVPPFTGPRAFDPVSGKPIPRVESSDPTKD
jgi:hypothetical protein